MVRLRYSPSSVLMRSGGTLGADLHLQRYAPGLTGLLVLNPAHSASAGVDLWSLVARTIDYAWCTMWIRTSESVAQIQNLFTGFCTTSRSSERLWTISLRRARSALLSRQWLKRSTFGASSRVPSTTRGALCGYDPADRRTDTEPIHWFLHYI